ncbi:MAG: hypothetical protein BWX79_03288 [Alphaproteobacteria bacterium ADurb.Bin100]|nr:MAG: hypothetical protein BWX79_03288 [Alphaproteobacteria bacterium ADurb.Bin100]
MAERGGGDDGVVADAHAVMHFVPFLQTAQDGDGIFHVGLVHIYRLEAAFQGGILFHMLLVFVERGGADAMQFPPRQGGF